MGKNIRKRKMDRRKGEIGERRMQRQKRNRRWKKVWRWRRKEFGCKRNMRGVERKIKEEGQ